MATIKYPLNYALGVAVQDFPKVQYAKITEMIDVLNAIQSGTLALNLNGLSVTGTTTLTGPTNVVGALTFRDSVISGQGSTSTLTVAQSGSTVLFDRAAGIVYTLPAATVANIGVTYTFITTVSITSNAAEVDAASSSDLMIGAVLMDKASATTPQSFTSNGTTNYKISSNGTSTGGLKGSQFTLTCVGLNAWAISGVCYGSGTLATPFAG
jgi:hypothetical protein